MCCQGHGRLIQNLHRPRRSGEDVVSPGERTGYNGRGIRDFKARTAPKTTMPAIAGMALEAPAFRHGA
jgi:hypothetical protein